MCGCVDHVACDNVDRSRFYRTDYQQGFGILSGEFWLGLDKIHRLTPQLWIDMQDFEGNSSYAQYSSFSVGDSVSKYTLSVSWYSGTAGDSLATGAFVPNGHNGQQFSTRDRDNDVNSNENCAQQFKGGWWYAACHSSNLNGLYHGGPHSSLADGVNWRSWRGYNYSLQFTEMKLRENWTPEYVCWRVHYSYVAAYSSYTVVILEQVVANFIRHLPTAQTYKHIWSPCEKLSWRKFQLSGHIPSY